jgi:hypothetical protein
MKLELKDDVEEQIVRAIASRVEDRFEERIKEAVRGAVKGAVERQTKELVDAAIAPIVEQVLAEGWQPTDQWGEPSGKKITLRARVSKRVSEYLEEKERYQDKTPAQKLIDEAIAAELRGEAGKVLEAARAKLREQVDGVLQAKLREVLASSLGLKVAP